MDRREFSNTLLKGVALLAIPNTFKESNCRCHNPKKPKKLKRGDTIGLIAPASPFSDEKYKKAIKNIESLGFKIREGKNLFKKNGYLAGTNIQRIEDLHSMFEDDTIDGIWCLRGGYGVGMLLPNLDYKLIKRNPKILIGYSDITALLIAIYQKTGLIGFHGPVASSTLTEYTKNNLLDIIIGGKKSIISNSLANQKISENNSAFKYRVINHGVMEGRLIGGNLSLISAHLGTDFEWIVKDKILFIEDIGEKPYRIDRMLTQLIQNQDLNKASGIILGIFDDCETMDETKSLTLEQVFKERLGHLNIPIVYGFSFGHIEDMATLPIGCNSIFDTNTGVLQLLESPVL